MLGSLRRFAHALLPPGDPPPPAAPAAPGGAADWRIRQRRVVLDDQYRLDHVWWELQERPATRRTASRYRVLRVDELVELPIESRDDPDLMGKSWAALRGLYRAGHDTLYLAVGVRAPDLTVAQLYGSAFEAASLDAAVAGAAEAQNAVRGVLANFLHSRLQAPSEVLWGHVQRHMRELPHLVALHGYPDPRAARKGLTRDGAFGADDDELASQQGEIFLRGTAALNKEFTFAMLAHALDRDTLIAGQSRLDRLAGEYASRQKGSLNAGFGAALPLAGSLGETQAASWAQGETDSTGDTVSRSESQTTGATESTGQSHGSTESRSETHGRTASQGWTHSAGQSVGQTHTQTQGTSRTESAGATESRGETETQGQTTGLGETETHSRGSTRSAGQSRSQAEAVGAQQGASWTVGQTESRGVTETTGRAWGRTESHATGHTHTHSQGAGQGWTTGATHSATQSQGSGQTQSRSLGTGFGYAQQQGQGWTASAATGTTETSQIGSGQSDSHDLKVLGVGAGHASTHTASHGLGQSASQSSGTSGSTTTGHSQAVQTAQQQGQTQTQGLAHAQGQSVGQSGSFQQSQAQGTSQSQGLAHSRSDSQSQGTSQSVGTSQSQGASRGQSRTHTLGTSHTESTGQAETSGTGQSRTQGASHATGRSAGWAQTHGQAQAQTQGTSVGQAQTASHTQGRSGSEGASHSVGLTRGLSRTQTTGHAQSTGQGWTTGDAQSTGWALTQSRGHTAGLTRGVSGGLVPTLSLGRSWQTEDDSAIRLTALCRDLAQIGFRAVKDGGWLTSAWILVEAGAADAAVALASQAFHGQNVPRPLQARVVAEDTALRDSLMALRGDTRRVRDPALIPWEGTEMLWNEYATMLPPSLLAAYFTPCLFEQGSTLTMQEKLPPLAFYPASAADGEVVLGHQVSPETAQLTQVPLRLSRARHFHTAFCGDTGYGKSVAAERLAYETTRRWGLRTLVLDFGTGWRKMLNAPGLEGRVEIRQLWPQGPRPLRWNPLQIGRRVPPELHWRTFCDIFGQIGQLGEKRQIHELRNVLGQVYREHGVFVDEQAVRRDPIWGAVRAAEAAALGTAAGTPLAGLDDAHRQALAVHRSRAVGFAELVTAIERQRQQIPPRDIRASMLDGILQRLATFVEGGARGQYAAGPAAVEICELVPEAGGIAVLEGGMFLDEFTKAFLLAWASWLIYTDTVIERLGRARSEPAQLQLVFEEANKILGGGVARQGEEGGPSVAERFEAMWRDSRKYGIWLHLLTQTPSAIPPGIMSSCNNLFVAQLKNAKDRDLVTSSMHRSEKGLVDEQWRKFLSRLPVARQVVKLGYALQSSAVEPVHMQPWLLDVEEPSDAQIADRLGRVELPL